MWRAFTEISGNTYISLFNLQRDIAVFRTVGEMLLELGCLRHKRQYFKLFRFQIFLRARVGFATPPCISEFLVYYRLTPSLPPPLATSLGAITAYALKIA